MKKTKTHKRLLNWLARKSDLYLDTRNQLRRAESSLQIMKRDSDELGERVAEISRKLCSVEVRRVNHSYPKLRVCIDIDSAILEYGFMHGDDHAAIEHVGREIGYRAAQEIQRANFRRSDIRPLGLEYADHINQ